LKTVYTVVSEVNVMLAVAVPVVQDEWNELQLPCAGAIRR
jgi:hypothetical protein